MPRQSTPESWLILDPANEPGFRGAVLALPRGTGILLLNDPPDREMRWLRDYARKRWLTIVSEADASAVRVHDIRELRLALLARVPLILLSPIYPTSSHPDRPPIARMRAAALARLGRRKLIALGGMDWRRYATVKRLGFNGWAGISAWQRSSTALRRKEEGR